MDIKTVTAHPDYRILSSFNEINSVRPTDRVDCGELAEVSFPLEFEVFKDEVFNIVDIRLDSVRAVYSSRGRVPWRSKKTLRPRAGSFVEPGLTRSDKKTKLSDNENVITYPSELAFFFVYISTDLLDHTHENFLGLEVNVSLILRNGVRLKLPMVVPGPNEHGDVALNRSRFSRVSMIFTALTGLVLYGLFAATFFPESDEKILAEVVGVNAFWVTVATVLTTYFCLPRLEGLTAVSKYSAYTKYPEFYFDAVLVKIIRSFPVFLTMLLLLFPSVSIHLAFTPVELKIPSTLPPGWGFHKIEDSLAVVTDCIPEVNENCGKQDQSPSTSESGDDSEPLSVLRDFALGILRRGSENTPEYVYRGDIKKYCLSVRLPQESRPLCVAKLLSNQDSTEVTLEFQNFRVEKNKKVSFKELLLSDFRPVSSTELPALSKKSQPFRYAYSVMMQPELALIDGSTQLHYKIVADKDRCPDDCIWDLLVTQYTPISEEYQQHLHELRLALNDKEAISEFNVARFLPAPGGKADELVLRDAVDSISNRIESRKAAFASPPFDNFHPAWGAREFGKLLYSSIRGSYVDMFYDDYLGASRANQNAYFLRSLERAGSRQNVRKYFFELGLALSNFQLSKTNSNFGTISKGEFEDFYHIVYQRPDERRQTIHCSAVPRVEDPKDVADACALLRSTRAEQLVTLLVLEQKTNNLISHDVITDHVLLRKKGVPVEDVSPGSFFVHDLSNYFFISAATGNLHGPRLQFFEEHAGSEDALDQVFFRCFIEAVLILASRDSKFRAGVGIPRDYRLPPPASSQSNECLSAYPLLLQERSS
ncbi:MAG: hypothetical protein V7742_14170 [Halioglobus sp.]